MIRNALKKYHTWRKRRDEIATLRALTDRDLADIGVNRWDIENIVDGLLHERTE